MTVKEYLESTYNPKDDYTVRKRITCKDGFSISVQGGTSFHYCSPREHVNIYNLVELGYPSEEEELINEYAEEKGSLTNTVYGGVPIELIEKVVEKHGGIKENN